MLKLQKSSLILILIIVVLTAGCVSIYTLGYTPGSVWHKAEDVKSGTFGQNVGGSNYNFPGNVGIGTTSSSSQLDVTGNIYATKQVTAGTMFKVGSSELSSSQLKVNGSSLVVTSTGNVGIGTTDPGSHKLNINGTLNATEIYENGIPLSEKYGSSGTTCTWTGNLGKKGPWICPAGEYVRGISFGDFEDSRGYCDNQSSGYWAYGPRCAALYCCN